MQKDKNSLRAHGDNSVVTGTSKGPKAGGLLGDAYKTKSKDILSSRFLVPPFSVLNTREGTWQDRKRQWISLGIQSELGRGFMTEGTAFGSVEEGRFGKPGEKSQYYKTRAQAGIADVKSGDVKQQLLVKRGYITTNPDRVGGGGLADGLAAARKYKDASPGGSPRPAMNYKNKERGDGTGRPLVRPVKPPFPAMEYAGHVPGSPLTRGDARGRPLNPGGLTFNHSDMDLYRKIEAGDEPETIGGTSVFDPVLCELAYRWFCPAGGRVLDPFAGGSVRGIVAAELGYSYTGIDLSGVQLKANIKQAEKILSPEKPRPLWIEGDSEYVLNGWGEEAACGDRSNEVDLIFSCPPYGDLEVYSENPLDLSNMPVEEFQEKYFRIIQGACALLADEGFACFVVGDYRDKNGFYQNLPAVTIAAFEACGLRLYNYAILLNAIGSLPLRINAQFNGSRKLGKTHQDVLIFSKGQPKAFVKNWPPIDSSTF